MLECLPPLFQSPLYLKIPVVLQTLKLPLTGTLPGSPESSKALLLYTLSPQGEDTDGRLHHHGDT